MFTGRTRGWRRRENLFDLFFKKNKEAEEKNNALNKKVAELEQDLKEKELIIEKQKEQIAAEPIS